MHFVKTFQNELNKLLIINTIKMDVIAKIAQVSYFCMFHTSFFIFADIMIVIKKHWTD